MSPEQGSALEALRSRARTRRALRYIKPNPHAFYVVEDGSVYRFALPIDAITAADLRSNRARHLPRKERRALVTVEAWRAGARAPRSLAKAAA